MSRLRIPIGPEDHVLGRADARITLVEYGDFQCPFCAAAYGEVNELQRALGPTLRFAYRHFPITQSHPYALPAAEAAEAAGAQGRFWDMHQILFERQGEIHPDAFPEFAAEIGLDVDRFVRDLVENRFLAKVRRDFASGVRSGVNGTPTFFVNDVRHDGQPTAESLLRTMKTVAAEEEMRL